MTTKSDERVDRSNPPLTHLEERIEWAARAFLGLLSVGALLLASSEDHEAIGTAMVGAAIAFGLGTGFFERIVEISTRGAKIGRSRLRREAARSAPDATPEEREELVEAGSEIIAERREKGETVDPSLAVREAKLSAEERHLASQANFANYLLEHEWNLPQLESRGGPDLIAAKGEHRIAVEIKASNRPAGAQIVAQAQALTRQAELAEPGGALHPVLVLGPQMRLTEHAAELAVAGDVSVYSVGGSHREVEHLAGPALP